MLNVILNQPKGSNFGPQIIELLRIIEEINVHGDEREIIFDFHQITFGRPLFILTLAGLIHQLRKENYSVSCNNDSLEYLKHIDFPEGLKPDEHSDWENILKKYSDKTYFPILNFPTRKTEKEVQIRNNSISCLDNLICKKLNLDPNTNSAVSYLISEMTDNITDHSGVERGWLFAQYYPTKKFIDICILDTGKTILQSYHDSSYKEITSHSEAIQKATEGVSTKLDKARGRGIPTTRRLIVNGMNGKFGLVSGNSILQNERITELPATWKGTFLALRVPQNPPNFDFYKFVE